MAATSLQFSFSLTSASANQSLNRVAEFFARVPDPIDLEDALLMAGLDSEYILARSTAIAQRAEKNGVLAKYDITFLEAQCIAMYTLDVPSEHGLSPYMVINNTLCGPHTPPNLIKIRNLIVLLLRALRKLPRVEKNVLYRGIRKDEGGQLSIGNEIMFWGFTSTSTNMTITKSFSNGKKGHLLVIEGPVHGYDLSEFSQFPNESEILLEPEIVVEIFGKGSDDSVIQCRTKPSDSVLVNVAPFTFSPRSTKAKTSPADDGSALFSLAIRYDNGYGVRQDKQIAAELYENASKKGHVEATFNLALCYRKGEGVRQNLKKAAELFQRASDMGHADAAFNLGVCYDNGTGVEEDRDKAVELFRLAARRGNPYGQAAVEKLGYS